MLALSLSACAPAVLHGPDPAPAFSSPSASPVLAAHPPVDPLSELKDPTAGRYQSPDLQIALHVHGVGPRQFSVPNPATEARSLRFYLSCQPQSQFKVTMGKFYSGTCSDRFSSTGTIPFQDRDESLTVQLDIPIGVRYWILAIAVN